ncbi:MAG: DUF1192 domain-containing protein [Pseudomonadota bacterium]
MFEESEPTPKPMDLERLSVADLQARIAELKAEIAACEAELAKKDAHKTAADALFGGSD